MAFMSKVKKVLIRSKLGKIRIQVVLLVYDPDPAPLSLIIKTYIDLLEPNLNTLIFIYLVRSKLIVSWDLNSNHRYISLLWIF